MQELSAISQYRLPVDVYLNNEWMGMVRQWQELNHGSRYSRKHTASLPDFVKLARNLQMTGLRAKTADQLDDVITTMLTTDGPVVATVCIEKEKLLFRLVQPIMRCC